MHVGHGDIFLEDLRAYREKNLAKLGMTGVFPIWKRGSHELVESFADLGFRAKLCCVEGSKLNAAFVGRELDLKLLADLPSGIDPAGENGEYHSFVYDGPIFRWPIKIQTGVTLTIDNRHYIDLLQTELPREAIATAESIPPV